jgi:hypothetical protein
LLLNVEDLPSSYSGLGDAPAREPCTPLARQESKSKAALKYIILANIEVGCVGRLHRINTFYISWLVTYLRNFVCFTVLLLDKRSTYKVAHYFLKHHNWYCQSWLPSSKVKNMISAIPTALKCINVSRQQNRSK